MKPGSDMSCAAASSLTCEPPPASSSSTWRRVRSASAANTLSSASSEYLTIRFSIYARCAAVKPARKTRNSSRRASLTPTASGTVFSAIAQ